MKTVAELQAALEEVTAMIAESRKNEIQLKLRMASEDTHKWLLDGGCLDCNGTGVSFPWAGTYDTIDCPSCNGRSPSYSLSCAEASRGADSPYFPEYNLAISDAVALHHRSAGGERKWKHVPFWTPARELERSNASRAMQALYAQKVEIECALRNAKLSSRQEQTPSGTHETASKLPALLGVSYKQIAFGKACREAAISGKYVNETEAASFIESRYWIDNFKHLLHR